MIDFSHKICYNNNVIRKGELKMRELVELIGKRNGYKDIDIWNCYDKIDNNIRKLSKAELKTNSEEIILLAIQYSLSLKLQMEYKDITNFVQERGL